MTLIKEQRIVINGKIMESFTHTVDTGDQLRIMLPRRPVIEHVIKKITITQPTVILFNKPKGYVVSKDDPHNKTIFDILPHTFRLKLYYIGRLDKDSHGLLLLTNEPQLVHAMEHPSAQITKEYIVMLDTSIDERTIVAATKGVSDDGEILRAQNIVPVNKTKNIVKVVLTEGKNRHIRRMFAGLGYQVEDLQRVRVGPFVLDNIPIGKYVTDQSSVSCQPDGTFIGIADHASQKT